MHSDKEWHVSKSINLGHIATTIAVVVSLLGYVLVADRRITRLEVGMQAVMDAQAEDRRRITNAITDMGADIEYIRRRLEERP